jgi:hypothetical protein
MSIETAPLQTGLLRFGAPTGQRDGLSQALRFALTLGSSCVNSASPMQNVEQSKARPVQSAKKDEGWREREEAKTARVTPRAPKKSNARESN